MIKLNLIDLKVKLLFCFEKKINKMKNVENLFKCKVEMDDLLFIIFLRLNCIIVG